MKQIQNEKELLTQIGKTVTSISFERDSCEEKLTIVFDNDTSVTIKAVCDFYGDALLCVFNKETP